MDVDLDPPRLAAPRLCPRLQALLRCPACRGILDLIDGALVCTVGACRARYHVVNDMPVLIDDHRSLLRAADVAAVLAAVPQSDRSHRRLRRVITALTPSITLNARAEANLKRLTSLLRARCPLPRVLVVGTGEARDRVDLLLAEDGVEIVLMDVIPHPGSVLVGDAQDLPFADGAFEAVVAPGLLHHVLDPRRSVKEIHRVLGIGGLVYAETPFMQQVAAGPHDFQRFTHLGHRRLFRCFEEIESGAVGGPGTALASAWRHFLWSFAHSRFMGFVLPTFAHFTSFFLKACDLYLLNRPRALDAASSVYFLGVRSERPLSDRELVAGYRGAQQLKVEGSRVPRPANEIFSQWAAAGRDEEMERNHAPAVKEMLTAALACCGDGPISAVDAGCGNGWVVRWLRAHHHCRAVVGVDSSAAMIAKARSIDPEGDYVLADVLAWRPLEPVDLVHSMEVLYYLDDPVALLQRIRTEWLRPGGWAVFGIDHYAENMASLAWPGRVGTRMRTWSQPRWRTALREAGFTEARIWLAAATDGAAGTLAMLARAPEAPL